MLRFFRTTLLSTLLLFFAWAFSGVQAKTAPQVELHTNKGVIVLQLDPVKAPVSTANFLRYVQEGHYNGTIFHRVINNFMIQGGGFTKDLKEKSTHDPIVNESSNGLLNKKYTIAMARTNVPNSATSQFFINVVDNAALDYRAPNARDIGYAVFGKVIEGMQVVDIIKAVATGSQAGYDDVPLSPVIIEKAIIRNKK